MCAIFSPTVRGWLFLRSRIARKSSTRSSARSTINCRGDYARGRSESARVAGLFEVHHRLGAHQGDLALQRGDATASAAGKIAGGGFAATGGDGFSACEMWSKCIRDSCSADVRRDAQSVLRSDPEVDRLCHSLFHRHLAEPNSPSGQKNFDILLAAQALERIGDHAKNLRKNFAVCSEGRSLRTTPGNCRRVAG